LGVIDTENYNIDVVLFHKSGIFLNMLPESVNVMEIGGDYRIFAKGILPAVAFFLGTLKWRNALNRVLFVLKHKTAKNKAVAEQQSWKYVAQSIRPLQKTYDVAIGFLEKSSIYYVVDKVNADKKIGWIHTNYANSGMDREFDEKYFKKLRHIVTVSDECGAALGQFFPDLSGKIEIIHNIVSEKLIYKLAGNGNAPELKDGQINIVSVGRLSPEKGFDLAIDACRVLVEAGVDVQWHVIGDGKERAVLEAQIKFNGLEANFHLLGAKENPYGYLKKALIYVQTSRYEGKSIAIDEAKIMRKPIVVTNFATVKDQIQNGNNGIVVSIDPQSIAAGILEMLNDEAIRETLVSTLEKENLTTESEIEKLYGLIENS
jgi:glycosyltransferase involved in cell wall biosynthesis